jgi:hypothetical protein
LIFLTEITLGGKKAFGKISLKNNHRRVETGRYTQEEIGQTRGRESAYKCGRLNILFLQAKKVGGRFNSPVVP